MSDAITGRHHSAAASPDHWPFLQVFAPINSAEPVSIFYLFAIDGAHQSISSAVVCQRRGCVMHSRQRSRGAVLDRASSSGAVARNGSYCCLIILVGAVFLLSLADCSETASAAGSAANVDAARIAGADQDPANWMSYGRTYSEQRFSPLSRITAGNAKQLGLAWYADLDSKGPGGDAARH
jgi:hypothetical protein